MSARLKPKAVHQLSSLLETLEDEEVGPNDVLINTDKQHVALLFDMEKSKSPVQLSQDELDNLEGDE